MKADFSTRLRHRITLQHRVDTQDPNTGAIQTGWGDLHVGVPAEVLTGAGREAVVSAAEAATTDARITMRWMPLENPQQLRILWDGQALDIKSAITDATARRWWRFECTEGLTDGR